jgi:preprotein translocase subunit SecY
MWMGELVTERGIGNGMSLLIFAGIAARIPGEGMTILKSRGAAIFAAVCVAALIIIIGVWCSSSRASAGSPCSTPSAWWAGGCTAAPRPICP